MRRVTLAFSLLLATLVVLFLLTQAYLSPISVDGLVVDDLTGHSVASATISWQTKESVSDADGRYHIELPRNSTLTIQHPQYQPLQLPIGSGGQLVVRLHPNIFRATVLDAYSGMPIAGAKATVGEVSGVMDSAGSFELVGLKAGAQITIEGEGYAPSSIIYDPHNSQMVSFSLRPNTLTGIVQDAKVGKPLAGARVSVGSQEVVTDGAGRYKLTGILDSSQLLVTVKAEGYQPARFEITQQTLLDMSLEPKVVKGLYATVYGMGDGVLLKQHILELVDKTEVNAIVMDIKDGGRGYIPYKSNIPLAKTIGAQDVITIKDIDGLIAELKAKGVYLIGRMIVFKDDNLARNGPKAGLDVAVRNSRTGGLWIDGENLAWVDPFRQEVWDYNIAIAKEAAQKGFDEIQFDYIRFPTDPSSGGSIDTAVYSKPNTQENRLAAVNSFLTKAKQELEPLGVKLAVDVFGYTTWRQDDMGIGQKIEEIAQHVDVVSPMVYPSTYEDGLPTNPGPTYVKAPAYPYEIVYYSLVRAKERLAGTGVEIRPWLQYFDDYPWESRTRYDAPQIELQKKAVADAGLTGWMMWDPFNKYERGGFGPGRD